MMKNKSKKVLLMGKGNAGKTSMRSIIFANYVAQGTSRLGPTYNFDNSSVKFLGKVLNLWDLGGQSTFMDDYFKNQKHVIFKNVEVLIYVFDVSNYEEQDIEYYTKSLDALKEYSQDVKIFCLVHKMDLIEKENRDKHYKLVKSAIEKASEPFDTTCFATSIWDETLYKAWASVVSSLIPNTDLIEKLLTKFCKLCEADEIVLFEKSTFLVISKATLKEHSDKQRFEKISNLLKLSFMKAQPQAYFKSLEIKSAKFTVFMKQFTENTNIMLVLSSSKIESEAISMNLEIARKSFKKKVKTI